MDFSDQIDVLKTTEHKSDGLLYIDSRGYLRFEPNIYPSIQIKTYTFFWRDNNAWRGPLNQGNINAVTRLFPNLTKDESIIRWEEKDSEEILLSPVAELSEAFPFQKEAIRFLVKRHKSMLCLAPGLGKTICAILAVKDLFGLTHSASVLIVSPLSLLQNWKKEIKKWAGDDAVIWHQNTSPDAQWIVTNYDTVRTRMTHVNSASTSKSRSVYRGYDFDILIIDESILIKNRKTQRTHAIKALAKNCKIVWMLSGSPTSKNYSDLWSQLNILDSTHFSAFWRFTENYCDVEQTQWGYQIYGNKKNAAAELHEDLEHIYYARTQQQVLPDLPDWIFKSLDIPMPKDQERVYGEMEETFVAQLTDDNALLAPNILTQMLRLIQLASNPILVEGKDVSAKWQAVIEMMQFVEKPVIIWTTFIETARRIRQQLEGKKYKVSELTGRTKKASRQNIVDAFQNDQIDAIIAHPAVGKFGFTLTRARTAIYLERSYNGDDYYQSLHRVRR
ncbi:hypothetical protein LCGC14_2405780, partial [marine sediment metagenome]